MRSQYIIGSIVGVVLLTLGAVVLGVARARSGTASSDLEQDELQFRVFSATTDGSSTEVVFGFEGMPADDVVSAWPALLTPDGTRHYPGGMTNSGTDTSRLVASFPALRAGDGYTLEVRNANFESRADRKRFADAVADGSWEGSKPPESEMVEGLWRADFAIEAADVAAEIVKVAASQPFGPGRIVIDELHILPDVTKVLGHIEGLHRDDLPFLEIMPARLMSGGSGHPFTTGRLGYGEGLSLFELEFSGTLNGSAMLIIPFNVGTGPPDMTPDRIKPYHGTEARLELQLD